MYCRKCGNKLGDADRFCQLCGTAAGYPESSAIPAEKNEIKEEVVFNPPYENRSRFTEEEPEHPEKSAAPEREDLKEFISDHEAKAAQGKTEDGGAGPAPAKKSEFTWNVYEFPTARKRTEDIEFNWNLEDRSQTEGKDALAAAFEEDLFREIGDDANRIKEQNIDRFFTFSRKSEEFQELLDREYDKIKMRSRPFREINVKRDTAEPGIEEAVPTMEIHREAEAQEDEAQVAESRKAEIPPKEELPAEEAPGMINIPEAEHLSEMAQARAQFFGDELIRDNESIRKILSSSGGPKEEPERAAELSEEPEQAAELSEEPERAAELSEKSEQAAELSEEPEQAAELSEESEQAAEKPAEPEPDAAIPVFGGAEAHKGRAGRIVLTIVAIILAAEIIILGIRYFAPDSAAAKATYDAQTRIYNAIAGFTGSIGDLFTGNGSNDKAPPGSENNTASSGAIDDQSAGQKQTDGGAAVPAPDPNPMADKDALVASQMGNNINIGQVKANAALAYQPGKNYGFSDINQSKPITNNIWQAPEGGAPVYYDKSVVGTVIAFDSRWIDYVNSGSRSVLDLLKQDSEAYRKTLAYSKAGKVKETFKLLEIGEIRQGAKGFYIWVHEEIGITEKGTAADRNYNWIYYLEPADGKMQIVNYFKF